MKPNLIIRECEVLHSLLNIDQNNMEYNKLFEIQSDKEFMHRLQRYYNKLQKMYNLQVGMKNANKAA